MYSMHQGEITRLRRGFANSTSGEQAPRPPSCECEVDSMSKLIEPRLIKLHNCDAHLCITIMERYRSGHNGADSKSVCAQAHEGSNPSLSAKARRDANRRSVFALQRIYPKCRAKIKNESLSLRQMRLSRTEAALIVMRFLRYIL